MTRSSRLLWIPGIAACAAGDTGSSAAGPGDAPSNPCPAASGLDDGVQWQYARPREAADAASMEGGAEVVVEAFTGDDAPFSLAIVARDTGTGPNEGQDALRTSRITVACEPEGLVVQSESATIGGQDLSYLYAPPVLVLPAAVADGAAWSVSGRVATGTAGGTSEDDYAVDFSARAVASFEVGAGSYEAIVIEAAGGERPGGTLDAFLGAYAAGVGHLQLWDLELASSQR